MNLEFQPDTSKVKDVAFRPFMIEAAYDYCMTALTATHRRGQIQQTLGTLAIEIVLKSFVAKPSANLGELNECYQVDRSQLPGKPSNLHNLKYLSQVLRPDLRIYLLGELHDDEVIEEHQDTFSNSRYYYEKSAPIHSSDSAIRLAAKMICKTVYLYKQRGCNDPFISRFDVNRLYFSVVQQIVFIQSTPE